MHLFGSSHSKFAKARNKIGWNDPGGRTTTNISFSVDRPSSKRVVGIYRYWTVMPVSLEYSRRFSHRADHKSRALYLMKRVSYRIDTMDDSLKNGICRSSQCVVSHGKNKRILVQNGYCSVMTFRLGRMEGAGDDRWEERKKRVKRSG